MAKMLATIDVLTGGRVTVGAGFVWLKESFDAVGADYEHRGAVTTSFIDAMRVVWTADAPEIAGKHFPLPTGMRFLPKPIQRPIPILIGGFFAARAAARAARGDGWIAPYQSRSVRREPAKGVGAREGNGSDPQRSSSSIKFDSRYSTRTDRRPTTASVRRSSRQVDTRRSRKAGVAHLQLKPAPGPSPMR